MYIRMPSPAAAPVRRVLIEEDTKRGRRAAAFPKTKIPDRIKMTVLVWIISLVSILCMLLRPRKIGEAWWVCAGALLLVVTGLLPLKSAGHAVAEGLDVYLFLTGMMILAEVAREEGVFEWAAGVAASHARHSSARLFATGVWGGSGGDGAAFERRNGGGADAGGAGRSTQGARGARNLICSAVRWWRMLRASFFRYRIRPTWWSSERDSSAAGMATDISAAVGSIDRRHVSVRAVAGAPRLKQKIERDLAPAPLTTEGRLAMAGLLLAAGALIVSSALGVPLGALTCCAAAAAAGGGRDAQSAHCAEGCARRRLVSAAAGGGPVCDCGGA